MVNKMGCDVTCLLVSPLICSTSAVPIKLVRSSLFTLTSPWYMNCSKSFMALRVTSLNTTESNYVFSLPLPSPGLSMWGKQ